MLYSKDKIKQLFSNLSLLLSILVIGFSHGSVSANPNNNQDTCQILFIGSSYFNYNNLPNIVQSLANSSGIDTYTEMCGANGMYLEDHANSVETEQKINERNWDYIILQSVGSLVAYPDSFIDHPVYPALICLRDKIYENCESTRIVFCMPWAFEDGMTWYQGWTDTFADMQLKIFDNTLIYSEEIGFEIAPVGWVWYAALEYYNYPLHYLHLSDWNHPSLRGSYLTACTIYSSVFQEAVIGNVYHSGLPEDEVSYFQRLASDTVLNNLELWNIAPIISDVFELSSLNEYVIDQNYPNPFSFETTFNFYSIEESQIEISIYDICGKKIKTLLNDYTNKGQYFVIWDGKNKFGNIVGNGVYICTLNTDNGVQLSQKVVFIR